MGLPVAKWDDCRQKCRCKAGPNEGRFYTVEQPCPFGYQFDEAQCDCGAPCDWCDDPNFNADDPEGWGTCHKESGEPAKGFEITLEGYLEGWVRYYPLPRCCRSTFNSQGIMEYQEGCPFDLEYWGSLEGPITVARLPCQQSNSEKNNCGDFKLVFDYRDAGCDAARAPENNPWKEGAFGWLYLVDDRFSPGDKDYQVAQILKPPGGSNLYNGSYWTGEVQIKLACYY